MLEEKSSLTPVSDLGEFGLIDRLVSGFTVSDKLLLKGPSDDAAVYDLENGKVLLVSSDLMAEGVHFDLSYAPLSHVGYKAVTTNLSDIYAMNGKPLGITVSIAFSNRFSVEALEELYQGIRFACEKYGVNLMGGDTSSSRSGLIVSVTAIGTCPKEEVIYRSGARETDLICVTGDLGAAYAGLQILNREKEVFLQNPDVQPDLAGHEYCVSRQLKPEARKDIIELFRKLEIHPTSMMDISDGLASELHHICNQSGTGCTIYQEKLPIDYETSRIAESFEISPATYALNGGEDYELVFTLPVQDFDKIKSCQDIHIVGHMVSRDRGLSLITSSGQMTDLVAQGFQHFGKA